MLSYAKLILLISCISHRMPFKSECRKCNDGYTRKMETEAVCGEDKTWSNKTPDCKGMLKGMLNKIKGLKKP